MNDRLRRGATTGVARKGGIFERGKVERASTVRVRIHQGTAPLETIEA